MLLRIAVFLLVFMPVMPCFAQTVTELQELSFGRGIVKNNNSVREIVISPAGTFTNDSEIVFIDDPERGIYRLTGATPFQTITSVNVTVNQQMIGAGEDFTLDAFNPSFPAQTDTNGEAIINLGARMRTTGSSINYQSSTIFGGILTLEVNLL